MAEYDKPHELESAAGDDRSSDEQFPREPFPCPACGQLLAPSCRVCVACEHTIDPAKIRKAAPAAVVAGDASRTLASVRFPWRLFFLFFWALMVGGIVSELLIGPSKTQLAVGALQLLSAIWVSFDASAKRVPKPLRWGLATLFPTTWLIILPWYLARRRQPEAPCPFIEARVSPARLALLFILLAVLFYVILKQAPPP
jgi:hypothetical protein